MAWLYQIHDAKGTVISKAEGFATQTAAIATGMAEADRLKRTGNIPASGFGMLTAEQDSRAWQAKRQRGSTVTRPLASGIKGKRPPGSGLSLNPCKLINEALGN
jgi:hypothetical protein